MGRRNSNEVVTAPEALVQSPVKIEETPRRNASLESIESLRARTAETEQQVKSLDQSLEAMRKQRDALAKERISILVAARARKEPAAQERLRAIDQELPPMVREIADGEQARAQLAEQLESLRDDLSRAEWESERSALKAKLAARIESAAAKRIADLTESLALALEEAREEDGAIALELIRFDSKLRIEANVIRQLGSVRTEAIEVRLKGFLSPRPFTMASPYPHRSHRLADLPVKDERVISKAIDGLDCLELID